MSRDVVAFGEILWDVIDGVDCPRLRTRRIGTYGDKSRVTAGV